MSCVAVGGRQIPAEGGNIFDHFEVNYLYPNGFRAFFGCRQIDNCWNENSDYILGTKGACTIGRGPMPNITGATDWTFTGRRTTCISTSTTCCSQSIRQDKPINDGERMATSTCSR